MNNRLHRFIFISLVIHACITILMLTIHFMTKTNIVQKKEQFVQFFDQPIPKQQQKTILIPEEKNINPQQKPSKPIKPIAPKKPLQTIEPEEEKPIYNDIIDLNYDMPTMIQKTAQNQEQPQPQSALKKEQRSDIKPKLPTKTQTIKKEVETAQETQPMQEQKNLQSSGLVHFPELQATKPFQSKSSTEKQEVKETIKLSAEELKQRALTTLLKKEASEEKTYSPKTIDLHEYLALKEEQTKNNALSDVATVQHSVQSTINSDIKNMGQAIYAKQFNNHLATSVHIIRAKSRIDPFAKNPISVELEINQYGKILHFAIIKSSGNPEFDKLFEDAIKLAEPFPAIPKHLGINRWRPSGLIVT